MTITRRRAAAETQRDGGIGSIGQLNPRAYARNSQALSVQTLIADARKTWKSRYGFDPAEVRFKGSR